MPSEPVSIAPSTRPDDGVESASRDPALLQNIRDIYDSGLVIADAQLGAVIEGLDARQLLDRAIVVVAGDHGEAFEGVESSGHQGLLKRAVLRVPQPVLLEYAWIAPPYWLSVGAGSHRILWRMGASGEIHDVSEAEPTQAAAMLQAAAAAAEGSTYRADRPVLSDKEREKLRRDGYW